MKEKKRNKKKKQQQQQQQKKKMKREKKEEILRISSATDTRLSQVDGGRRPEIVIGPLESDSGLFDLFSLLLLLVTNRCAPKIVYYKFPFNFTAHPIPMLMTRYLFRIWNRNSSKQLESKELKKIQFLKHLFLVALVGVFFFSYIRGGKKIKNFGYKKKMEHFSSFLSVPRARAQRVIPGAIHHDAAAEHFGRRSGATSTTTTTFNNICKNKNKDGNKKQKEERSPSLFTVIFFPPFSSWKIDKTKRPWSSYADSSGHHFIYTRRSFFCFLFFFFFFFFFFLIRLMDHLLHPKKRAQLITKRLLNDELWLLWIVLAYLRRWWEGGGTDGGRGKKEKSSNGRQLQLSISKNLERILIESLILLPKTTPGAQISHNYHHHHHVKMRNEKQIRKKTTTKLYCRFV